MTDFPRTLKISQGLIEGQPIPAINRTHLELADMDTNIVSSLRYVELEANGAYVDSRVYCREVIEVDHADWMRDTLRKYQSMVEQRFGEIRFETDVATRPQGGGTPQQYALLTEAQTNALLVFSRNSAKISERKLDLIADFEQAKQFVRQSFVQRLATTETATQLKTALTTFPNTLDKLWKTSGIVSKYQVKNAILRDFVEERDYIWADGILCLNDSTYHILGISFRSLKGADVDQLPKIIQLKTRDYFRYQADKKMNRRIAQNSEWEQPLLPLIY